MNNSQPAPGARPKYQGGQAIILGMIFLAAALMMLFFLYNQGQLVKHRVQLENAADATVYSQAKLGARNQNFIAYTNRSMIANELSIGQLSALMSWAAHYRDVSLYTNHPVYQVPVVPISPVPTWAQVLTVAMTPYRVTGTIAYNAASPVARQWPSVVSAYNKVLGGFQLAFALSTLAAQFETHFEVVDGNQLGPEEKDIYAPFMSFFFLLQNALLTAGGENIDAAPFVDSVEEFFNSPDTGDADPGDMVRDYFPGETMILRNSPDMAEGEEADDILEAYKFYQAVVNENRDPFTADRHWRVGPDETFSLVVPLGIIVFDFNIGIFAGVKNDGGTIYGSKTSMSSTADLKKLGWSSVDMMSFGIEVDIEVGITIQMCLPFVGCIVIRPPPIVFPRISAGFPLAGATNQLIGNAADAKLLMPEWGMPGQNDGPYGGDEADGRNQGPFDMFHLLGLGHTQMLGRWGTDPTLNTYSYGMPPSFLSLGDHFRDKGAGYEYTVALAIDMGSIETSDALPDPMRPLGSTETGLSGQDWLPENRETIAYDRFDLDSCARNEEIRSAEGLYQRFVWGSERAMTTLSSAEVYFSNPMQRQSDGSPEPANLFSPFWDARLIEPSLVPTLIATGELPWDELLGEDVPNDAIGLVGWLLNRKAEEVVDGAFESVVDATPAPFGGVLEDALDPVGNSVKGVASDVVDVITDGLGDFIEANGPVGNCQS